MVVRAVVGELDVLAGVLAQADPVHHALGAGLLLLGGEIHVVALDVLLEGDIDGDPELVAGALLRLDAEVAGHVLGVLVDLVLGAGEVHLPAPAGHIARGGLAQGDGVVVHGDLHGHVGPGGAGGQAQRQGQRQGQRGNSLEDVHILFSLLISCFGRKRSLLVSAQRGEK